MFLITEDLIRSIWFIYVILMSCLNLPVYSLLLQNTAIDFYVLFLCWCFFLSCHFFLGQFSLVKYLHIMPISESLQKHAAVWPHSVWCEMQVKIGEWGKHLSMIIYTQEGLKGQDVVLVIVLYVCLGLWKIRQVLDVEAHVFYTDSTGSQKKILYFHHALEFYNNNENFHMSETFGWNFVCFNCVWDFNFTVSMEPWERIKDYSRLGVYKLPWDTIGIVSLSCTFITENIWNKILDLSVTGMVQIYAYDSFSITCTMHVHCWFSTMRAVYRSLSATGTVHC